MPRTFNDYGPVMQRFLKRALNEGVALDDPIATKLIRRGYTRAQILEAAGLVYVRESKKGRLIWKVTEEGRRLTTEHRSVFMHRRGFPSYTNKPWQAMHGEGEVMDEAA